MSDHLNNLTFFEQFLLYSTLFCGATEAGQTLVILKTGKPVAEVKPLVSGLTTPRPFGLCAGEFTVPDDFDAPLSEAIIKEFEG